MNHNLVSVFIEKLGIEAESLDEGFKSLIFEELSRKEEIDNSIRDQWGNWDFSYNNSFKEGRLFIPWIDDSLAKKGLMSPETHWPNGKKFALCITHDVDSVSDSLFTNVFRSINQAFFWAEDISLKEKVKELMMGAVAICRLGVKGNRSSLIDYHDLLNFEGELDYKSTFFIFPSDFSRHSKYDCLYKYTDRVYFNGEQMTVSDIIQEIDRLGWEVGLHGSILSASDLSLLIQEKQLLESYLNHEVISIRNHYLKYDMRITPDIQAKAGFLIDSTQGFNRAVGFRAATSFPYPCFNHKKNEVLPLWEIPQHIMDGALFTSNALEYNENYAISLASKIMDNVEQVGGVLCINWHPDNMHQELWFKVYKRILLEAYRRNAWGCSLQELYNYWINRG